MKRKLLLVDDELNILQGLKRMMRSHSKDWQVSIADSGDQALSMLSESEYDCIISDMRMPGLDGAALLKKVHDEYPHVTRFILSGYADSEPIMNAVPVAHQFLAKPCSAEQLVDTVTRACDLQNLIENDSLKAIIGKVDALPSRPDIYSQLTGVLATENSSLDEVANIIKKDVGISAKLLQIVNSAFFGLAQNLSEIHSAVSYLGLSTIKSLVLSEEVFRVFAKADSIPGFSLEKEHQYATQMANIAKPLLKDKVQMDDAFMAGMLHGTGRLVIAEYEPDRLKAVLAEQSDYAGPLHKLEEEKIGVPCSYIGAYLLGLWGLPYPVVEAVAHYHTPWAVPHAEFQILDALYLADCWLKDVQTGGDSVDMDYFEKLGVAEQVPFWRENAEELLQTSAGGAH